MKKFIILFTLSLLSLECLSQEKDSIYVNPDVPPSFPGGLDSLKRFVFTEEFLSKNIKWPHSRFEEENKVFVQFIVNEDGSLSDIKILKEGQCKPCEQIALDVVHKMPNWIPGKMEDKPVKAKAVFPMVFRFTP